MADAAPKTADETDNAIREGLAYLVRAAMENDPSLTKPKVKAILGATERLIALKYGWRTKG